jgi:MYXO-CTERM domain-containing protein
VGVVAAIAIALVASVASARPEYAAVVEEVSGMPCLPNCQLCHDISNPTAGSGVPMVGDGHPFYDSLVNNFGAGNSEEQMKAALEQYKTSGLNGFTDVNINEVNDIEDLANQVNPNGDGVPLCQGAEYGCGARVAPGQSVDRYGALLASLVALGLSFRLRRRRPARG